MRGRRNCHIPSFGAAGFLCLIAWQSSQGLAVPRPVGSSFADLELNGNVVSEWAPRDHPGDDTPLSQAVRNASTTTWTQSCNLHLAARMPSYFLRTSHSTSELLERVESAREGEGQEHAADGWASQAWAQLPNLSYYRQVALNDPTGAGEIRLDKPKPTDGRIRSNDPLIQPFLEVLQIVSSLPQFESSIDFTTGTLATQRVNDKVKSLWEFGKDGYLSRYTILTELSNPQPRVPMVASFSGYDPRNDLPRSVEVQYYVRGTGGLLRVCRLNVEKAAPVEGADISSRLDAKTGDSVRDNRFDPPFVYTLKSNQLPKDAEAATAQSQQKQIHERDKSYQDIAAKQKREAGGPNRLVQGLLYAGGLLIGIGIFYKLFRRKG